MKKLLTLFAVIFLTSYLASHVSVASAQTLPPVQSDFAVSAFIPPHVSDFQFDLHSNAGHRVSQQQTISYEITYGASSSATLSTTTTVVVDFAHDTTSDGTHVVDYVFGSASTGYNELQPVVDLKKRTITWIMPNIPAGIIGQKLTFQLKTNANYTQEKTVNTTVTARMSNQYVTMPVKTITHEYFFDTTRITPDPTKPQPTTPPAIPTASPTPLPVRIQSISFNAISATQTGITIKTNRPTKLFLRYGTSPGALNQYIQTDKFAVNSYMLMKGLKPDTSYFFRITATDATRKTALSELFTFTTALDSALPELFHDAVVITSKEAIVLSDILNGANTPFGIVTAHTDYVFTYTFRLYTALAKMETVIKDSNGNEIQVVTMNGTSDRVYTARLRTDQPSSYSVYVRITDSNGNVLEQRAATIKVLRPLHVVETETAIPVGDARVLIKFFNEHTKQYELLPHDRFGNNANPAFTQSHGELDLLLPTGRYQAEISAIGYDAESVTFDLGQANGQNYPTVYLNKNLTNFTALFQFFQDWQVDTLAYVQNAMLELFASIRFFNSIAFATLLSFINLGFIMFGLRTGISVREIAPFFLFHLFVVTQRHKGAYLYGLIVDHLNNPVSQAVIEVIDLKTNIVLTHTISTKSGTFALKNIFNQQFIKLIVGKEGYPETERIIPTNTEAPIKIGLHVHAKLQGPIKRGVTHTFGELFEITLLFCLITELLFILTFGVAKTLPFIILSIFNLSLWIFFQREKKLF